MTFKKCKCNLHPCKAHITGQLKMNKKTLPSKSHHGNFVQTDREAHEAWARLTLKHPTASAIMHLLASRVGDHNAVVISQSTLAKLLGVSRPTISKSIQVLNAERWIEIRQVGGSGSTNAYVLNDRAAWIKSRDGLRYSLFSATVIASEEEQPDRESLENQEPLRGLPRIGEIQIPIGDGLPPPSQPFFEGMEPDLPEARNIEKD